jgi:hypothetical protein
MPDDKKVPDSVGLSDEQLEVIRWRAGECAGASFWMLPVQLIETSYRQDIPALLVEVDRLRAENAALRNIAEAMAKYYPLPVEGWFECDFCDARSYGADDFGHRSNCPVTKARALLGTPDAQ